MMKLGAALAAIVLMGCPSPQPPQPGARCGLAAYAVREVFDRTMKERGEPAPGELSEHVQTVVKERCVADQWSVQATSCLREAKDDDALETCAKTTLTEAQNDAVDDAIEAGLPHSKAKESSASPTDDAEGGSGARSMDDPCGGDADGAADDPCGGDADQ